MPGRRRGTCPQTVVVLALVCGSLAAGLAACTGEVRAEPLAVVTVLPPVVPADLPETLVVTSDGSESCPGFTVAIPSPHLDSSSGGAVLEPDGSGLLGSVWPAGTRARISFTCFGRTADLGTLSEFTADVPDGENPLIVLDGEVVEVRAAMGESVRRDERVGEKEGMFTEWYLERDGWLMGVVFIRPPEEAKDLEPVIESVLASWTWT